jgi:hypothetical protein
VKAAAEAGFLPWPEIMTENRVTIIDDAEPTPLRPSKAGLIAGGVIVVALGGLALFGTFDGPEPTPGAQPVATVPTTEPTTTTASPEGLASLEYDTDVELIHQLWQDETTAWTGGFDNGLQFWVDNNYPDMGCSVDDYMAARFSDGRIDGLQIQRVANPPSIGLDEGWIIPGGRLEGVPAKGRVYMMSITESLSAPGHLTAPPNTRNLHVTILDDQAHFFFGCSA